MAEWEKREIMDKVSMKEIWSEQELRDVLKLCYDVLGPDLSELYSYDAWYRRFLGGREPLVYAQAGDGRVVSAVLGREENKDSLVIGFVACHKDYRRQGITRGLMQYLEGLAREKGYKYITLGSKEDVFYEACGYQVIFQVHGQNIYQKVL